MNNIENNKGEIILYQPDETIRLEVRMGEDTVWPTQQQMAELFNKDRTDIGRHIRNIYKEEELERDITCAKFAHMGTEGDQQYEYTANKRSGFVERNKMKNYTYCNGSIGPNCTMKMNVYKYKNRGAPILPNATNLTNFKYKLSESLPDE